MAGKPKIQVKIGDVFGKLTVKSEPYGKFLKNDSRKRRFVDVTCECGYTYSILVDTLQNNIRSCRFCGYLSITKHGLSGSRFYYILEHIYRRCYVKETEGYKRYGGRGITVCDDWNRSIVGRAKALENFFSWAKDRYKPGLQIDRIDNEKGYSPENCRWVTASANCRNKSNNTFYTLGNETKCIAAWAEDARCLVSDKTLTNRLIKGWDFWLALTTPAKQITPRIITFLGETKIISGWSKDSRCVVSRGTLRQRIRYGWDFYDALTTPTGEKPLSRNSQNRPTTGTDLPKAP